VRPFGGRDLVRRDLFEREYDVDTPEHQDVVFEFDLSMCHGRQLIAAGCNLARFQRAA
jgi:hypothetical protein